MSGRLVRTAIALAAMLLATAIAAGSVQQGIAAYDAKRYEQARTILLPMGQEGDPVAQYYLGRMYEKAQGVSRDFEVALSWYRKSARQGFAPSEYRLAIAYHYGVGGVRADDAEALKWLRRAAENGYKKAQKVLAGAYERGELGLERDATEARRWKEKADARP